MERALKCATPILHIPFTQTPQFTVLHTIWGPLHNNMYLKLGGHSKNKTHLNLDLTH